MEKMSQNWKFCILMKGLLNYWCLSDFVNHVYCLKNGCRKELKPQIKTKNQDEIWLNKTIKAKVRQEWENREAGLFSFGVKDHRREKSGSGFTDQLQLETCRYNQSHSFFASLLLFHFLPFWPLLQSADAPSLKAQQKPDLHAFRITTFGCFPLELNMKCETEEFILVLFSAGARWSLKMTFDLSFFTYKVIIIQSVLWLWCILFRAKHW